MKLLALTILAFKLIGPGPWRDARVALRLGERWRRLFSAETNPGHWKWKLPAAMVCFRAALGPGIVLISLKSRSGLLLAGCIVAALVSDVFDGVLARRWHVDTARLRVGDTIADTIFYSGVLAVIVLRYPAALRGRWLLLAALIAVEVGQHAFAFAKFGRNASYHSILAKCWGLWMAAATIGLLGFGLDNWLLDVTIAWGILCNLEGFAMTLVLPKWRHDILTLGHALRMRRTLESQGEYLGV
jgi:phosphatidylglycerophosphate synthase